MLSFLTIDLAALAPWAGKIDGTDAMLVGLIRSLDPRNPTVRQRMLGDYLMFTTAYIAGQIPMIDLAPRTIKTRIARLVALGIIDRVAWFNKRTGHKCRYVKLSKLYYKAEDRAHRDAERSLTRAREYRAENGPTLGPKTAHDHKTMIKESPPSLKAAGGASEKEKTSAPRCPACKGDASNSLHYDYVSCDRCGKEWPGGVRAREYFGVTKEQEAMKRR
jgi:ribosomal protein L37AE/L43A